MRARLVRSAPLQLRPCLPSRTPAPLGQHVDVKFTQRGADDSDGHYYCIVEDGGEGKEKREDTVGQSSVDGTSNRELPGGI